MNLTDEARGFDHVRCCRLAAALRPGAAPDFTLAAEIFTRLILSSPNALNNGLAVMINVHHFNEIGPGPGGADGKVSRVVAPNRGRITRTSPPARVRTR